MRVSVCLFVNCSPIVYLIDLKLCTVVGEICGKVYDIVSLTYIQIEGVRGREK